MWNLLYLVVDKKKLTLEPKKGPEKDSFEGNQRMQKSYAHLSPQTTAKNREAARLEQSKKKAQIKENIAKLNDSVSPRNVAMQKSPVRSSRNQLKKDLGKDINLTGLTQTKSIGSHKKSLSMQETACSSAVSRGCEFPTDAKSALEFVGAQMSPLEKEEILKYNQIYYVGDRYHKIPAKEDKDYDDEKYL